MVATAVLLTVLGCRAQNPTPERPRLQVVVSVLPHVYFVQQVGGDDVEVTALIPPGASPETFEPTPRQVDALRRARVYVKVGHPALPFEATWLDKLLQERTDLLVVDASRGVELIPEDPHIWLSPRDAIAQGRNIARGLAQVDLANAAQYQRRSDAWARDLEALSRELHQVLAPVRDRSFLVFHPAFGYLAREFGLHQIALEQHHKEPGPRELEDFVARARTLATSTVFAQAQFDQRHARAVAAQLGGEVVVLDPLAENWRDNLRHIAGELARRLRPR